MRAREKERRRRASKSEMERQGGRMTNFELASYGTREDFPDVITNDVKRCGIYTQRSQNYSVPFIFTHQPSGQYIAKIVIKCVFKLYVIYFIIQNFYRRRHISTFRWSNAIKEYISNSRSITHLHNDDASEERLKAKAIEGLKARWKSVDRL